MIGSESKQYTFPADPRTGLEALRCMLFEFPRCRSWSQDLTLQTALVMYLRALPWITLIALVLYLTHLAVSTWLEIPPVSREQADSQLVSSFQSQRGFLSRFMNSLHLTVTQFLLGLALGLTVGLVASVLFGLTVGLALGLTISPAAGLADLSFGYFGLVLLGVLAGLVVGGLPRYGGFDSAVRVGASFTLGLTRNFLGLSLGLAMGLAAGLIIGFAGGLVFGLNGGLQVGQPGILPGLARRSAVSLVGGLMFCLVGGLGGSLVGGFTGGLGGLGSLGFLAEELRRDPVFRKVVLTVLLVFLLVVLLIVVPEGILALVPLGGLAFSVGLVIGWLRIPFYIFQLLTKFRSLDLRHNPYLWDVAVRLPIWGANSKLAAAAAHDPNTGDAFAAFLLEHRPLQRNLAAEILHAGVAAKWSLNPLAPEVLDEPPVVEGALAFRVSDVWSDKLRALRQDLTAARMQSGTSFRREAFTRLDKQLANFRNLTLRESPRWGRYYLKPLDHWQAELRKEIQQLETLAHTMEPITANSYRPGMPLRPERDKDIFFCRKDLRDDLVHQILTAREMPLFLFQGQRRVGKTSLLYFLPDRLPAGFQVVYQDLQDAAITSVTAWMQDLRRRISRTINKPMRDWMPPPRDWVLAWAQMQDWLNDATAWSGDKLIVAMDEYETLHFYLQEEKEQGRRLLAALRSFSQQQNRVVFLFVGSTPFSELRAPDWSEFFVHAVRFQVDYLSKPDALDLITRPVHLHYPSELPERLFDLTQGHPALIQSLCQQLVNIANGDGRRNMRMEDLDEAVMRAIDKETPVMERFWQEFCRHPECRICVEQILRGDKPDDRAALLRLEEHGYVVKKDGCWRLRVPLFDDWLRKYRDAF